MIFFHKNSALNNLIYESKSGSKVQYQVGSVLLRTDTINVL